MTYVDLAQEVMKVALKEGIDCSHITVSELAEVGFEEEVRIAKAKVFVSKDSLLVNAMMAMRQALVGARA